MSFMGLGLNHLIHMDCGSIELCAFVSWIFNGGTEIPQASVKVSKRLVNRFHFGLSVKESHNVLPLH